MNRFLKVLLWTAISLLGVIAVLVSAVQRGEPVNALWLVIAGVCTFAISWRFYSAWLMARVLSLDDHRAPPALTRADGKDFVPTHKWIVFGHHFAAIAGPGPLVGPVLAAQFGYLPGVLWILIGATLGGGVHDAVVLFCSMRRDGKSLGRMLREEINPFIGLVAMISLLLIITIILAVLGLVVVNALAHSPWGLFTIAMTIPVAMVMGLALRSGRFSVGSVTLFGVLSLLACVAGGRLLTPEMNAALTWSPVSLAWAIMIYGFAASVLPVWLLLAPRDYLSTFMKLGTVAVLGIFIVIVAPPLHMPPVTKFIHGGGWVVPGPVFPFVCITIACGAVSGFHSLISSGTTPKLLQRERHIRLVGYGSMITEMLVALMAIIAACALEPGVYFAINTPANAADPASLNAAVQQAASAGFPVSAEEMAALAARMGEPTLIGKVGGAPTFAVGMAAMFDRVMPGNLLDLWYHFAIMFEALFILTTLDAGTRVGRFIMQDVLGNFSPRLADTGSWFANVLTSALLVAAWGWFLYHGAIFPGGIAKSLWPIFGIANQLLAVIAFCLGTTVLIKMGRARYAWVTAVPMLVLTAITFSAGILKIFSPGSAGFLPLIRATEAKLAAGGLTEAEESLARTTLVNAWVDVAVTGTFLLLVATVVTGCAMVWIRLLRGTAAPKLHESPYVPLSSFGAAQETAS